MRRCRSVMWIAALALVVSSCTGGEASPRPSPTEPAVPRGGTLRVAAEDLGGGLDPQKSYDNRYRDWELFRCCLLRTLLSYNGRPGDEGGGVPQPDLAASFPEISPDGLTWTFHLKAGIRYAPPYDDTDIVAGDLIRALRREADPGVTPYDADCHDPDACGYPFYYSIIEGFDAYRAGDADAISGVEAPDEHTLVFHLVEQTGTFAYLMALPATAPIPEGAADSHDDGYGRFLVASGPYMIQGSEELDPAQPAAEQTPVAGYEPGRSLTLVRNPSWVPATDGLRGAFVDRIEVTLGLSPARAASRVDRGELDLPLDGSPPEQTVRYRADPELAQRLFENEISSTLYLTMNLAVPPFDDVHVRRAVNYSIDKAEVIRAWDRDPGPVFPSARIATHIAPDGVQGALLSAYDPYPFNASMAAAEMARSRYDGNGDGVCDAAACSGVATAVNTVFPSKGASVILDGLRAIGIRPRTRALPIDPFFDALAPSRRTALGIVGAWQIDFPDPSQYGTDLFGSGSLSGCCNWSLLGATASQLRSWGYQVRSVPDVDERIDRCTPLTGLSALDCWVGFDQYLTTEIVPWVPLMTGTRIFAVSDQVVRYKFDQFTFLPALDQIALAPGSD